MTGPGWLADPLAALMILTAAYCVSRLVISRVWHRRAEHQVDATHAVMAVAMAGMLTTSLKFLPDGAWAVLFAVAAAWFAWRVARYQLGRRADPGPAGQRPASGHRRHDVPILLMCAAMLYMLLAETSLTPRGAGGITGMSGSAGNESTHFTILAFALALLLFGYAVRETDHLPALARVSDLRAGQQQAGQQQAAAAAGGLPLSPRLAATCQIAMAVTMAYMLLLML